MHQSGRLNPRVFECPLFSSTIYLWIPIHVIHPLKNWHETVQQKKGIACVRIDILKGYVSLFCSSLSCTMTIMRWNLRTTRLATPAVKPQKRLFWEWGNDSWCKATGNCEFRALRWIKSSRCSRSRYLITRTRNVIMT